VLAAQDPLTAPYAHDIRSTGSSLRVGHGVTETRSEDEVGGRGRRTRSEDEVGGRGQTHLVQDREEQEKAVGHKIKNRYASPDLTIVVWLAVGAMQPHRL
jgi:hypothetical protein